MKKITKENIDSLYTFTKNHFVEYYDLQTELVDHLANDIELMWQEEPNISFEESKTKAFKKFGIFGFMESIEQKQKAINKKYMRYLWIELKKWFAIPQIITTITLFLVFYLSFTTSYAMHLLIIFYLIIAFFGVYKSITLKNNFKKREQKANKKWLLEEIIFRQAGVNSLVLLTQIQVFLSVSKESFNNPKIIFGLALTFTILVLISYIILVLLPRKADELINETYPEFSL